MDQSAKLRCLILIKNVQDLSQVTNIPVPALLLSSYMNERDDYKSYLIG